MWCIVYKNKECCLTSYNSWSSLTQQKKIALKYHGKSGWSRKIDLQWINRTSGNWGATAKQRTLSFCWCCSLQKRIIFLPMTHMVVDSYPKYIKITTSCIFRKQILKILILKIVYRTKERILNKEISNGEKHLKKWLAPLIIREVQIKITLRFLSSMYHNG